VDQHGLQTRIDVGELTALASRGLAAMFNPEKQLFCFRMKRTTQGVVQEGTSVRYTIISLLGLHRLQGTGVESPIDVRAIVNNLLKEKCRITTLGDFGLLLWLCALAAPDRLDEINAGVHLRPVLSNYANAHEGRTMELAWLLSGLAHAALAQRKYLYLLTDSAVRAFDLLNHNYGSAGIFGHQRRSGTLAGVIRGRIGTFADQVYPIYALSRFAQAFHIEGALEIAQCCAEAIIRAQGPLGQWPWHYDSVKGKAIRRYPVFSVHQDGMAPMALFALGEATGFDFSEPVYRGLHWIEGNNELGLSMQDDSAKVIWRSIHRKKYRMFLDEAWNFLGPGTEAADSGRDLTINFECRPYHFGWLLYAFAPYAQEMTAESLKQPSTRGTHHADLPLDLDLRRKAWSKV
jgi:hypothetical protein